MILQNKRLIIIAAIVLSLLLIPLIAMQFTDEVNWNAFDFVLMGTILFGIGLAYEFLAQRSGKTVYRAGLAVGLAGAFLLFWVSGAVGIIGNEGNPANLMYGAVFAVGIIGSILARFKAIGMFRTMFLAATIQMLVPVIAFFIWPPTEISWSPGLFGVFLLNTFFVLMFVVSALLFRHAGVRKD